MFRLADHRICLCAADEWLLVTSHPATLLTLGSRYSELPEQRNARRFLAYLARPQWIETDLHEKLVLSVRRRERKLPPTLHPCRCLILPRFSPG